MVNHFANLYNKSSKVRLREINCQFKAFFESSAKLLEQLFTQKEVQETITSYDDNKAPGPNGFNFNFLKKQWGVIKDDIMRYVDDLYHMNSIDGCVNIFFITLVFKCASSSSLSKYWPINLIGCLYKIITKALANLLRGVMDEIMGENQFAFIKG